MPRRRPQGFTLVELMVVVTIIGVIVALSMFGLQDLNERGAALNAANDLSAKLAMARTRALERGSDVWFIVYPAQGSGAYFVFEDRDLRFGAGTATRTFANFAPPNAVEPDTADVGVLLESVYLDDYPGENVTFGTPASTITLPSIFSDLTAATCNFCSGTPARGAIVFGADGSARLVKSDGTAYTTSNATAGGRAALLGLNGTKTRHSFAFVVSGPTGFIGSYDR